MEGILEKRSAWVKSWNSRYCVLDPKRRVITYYKAKGDAQAKGEIVLDRAVLSNHPAKPYAFVVRTAVGEENLLAAATDAKKKEWMAAVADCISGRKKPVAAASAAATKSTTTTAVAKPSSAVAPPAAEPPPPPPGATDPLAYLMDVGGGQSTGSGGSSNSSAKSVSATKTAAASKPKSKPKPATAAPAFFMSSASAPASSGKKFPCTGEGLREAIKEKNVTEVTRLLSESPKLCTYADQQGQTLLHLAAMFGHTTIALQLVKAGADPLAKNPQGETPVDLAPVVLGNKLKSAVG